MRLLRRINDSLDSKDTAPQQFYIFFVGSKTYRWRSLIRFIVLQWRRKGLWVQCTTKPEIRWIFIHVCFFIDLRLCQRTNETWSQKHIYLYRFVFFIVNRWASRKSLHSMKRFSRHDHCTLYGVWCTQCQCHLKNTQISIQRITFDV